MYCIYFLLFPKCTFGLCKDFRFRFLYFESLCENFIDYQPLIVLLFTFIVIVFHYQMLHRKKAEIFCKILVGDTVFHITIRYALDCIMILAFAYILSVLANVYLNFNLTSSLYLVPILITYILISARQVRKYENF